MEKNDNCHTSSCDPARSMVPEIAGLPREWGSTRAGSSCTWVGRKLPGKFLHNIISHGICKIAEFLPGEKPNVIAHGFPSQLLRSIGEKDIVDELRVIINDGNEVTEYFTFSTQMSPKLHQLRLYGTKNALILDDDHQTLIRLNGSKYKNFLDQFIPPWIIAKEYACNSFFNVRKFLRRDFHSNHGMKILFDSFYRSMNGEGPAPIPYKGNSAYGEDHGQNFFPVAGK